MLTLFLYLLSYLFRIAYCVLGLVTLFAVQGVAQELLPAGFGQHPGAGDKRWVMARVLFMAASQHRPPITHFILFKGDNLLFHSRPNQKE
jgi:hypothetical protein